jgi:O-Antigen ligase
VKVGYKLLVALTLAAITWGVLAFGAVYDWAYGPLAVVSAFTGLISLLVLRPRAETGALALALTGVALAISLQLLPVPVATLQRVSPAADQFLRQYDFAYVTGSWAHPLSIGPRETALGLGLVGAFTVFLFGTIRLLSAVGIAQLVPRIAVIGVVVALIGIVQYALLGNSEREPIKIYGFWVPQYRAMSFGPFVNRNHFAGCMLMTLPLALGSACAAAASAPERICGWRDYFRWMSSPSGAGMVLGLGAAFVMALALMLSESRSGMAGFGVGAALFGWLVIRRLKSTATRTVTSVVFLISIVALAGWAGADMLARRVSALGADLESVGGRRAAWADSVRIVGDFPLTGTGFNTFGMAMKQYQSMQGPLQFEEAHNDYLQLAAEGGLLVGLPIVLAILLFVRNVRRRFAEAPHSGRTYWLRVAAVIGLVSIALQSLVEFSLQMPGNAVIFATLAAAALHRSPNVRSTKRSGAATPPSDPARKRGQPASAVGGPNGRRGA